MTRGTVWHYVALPEAVDFLDSQRRPVKVGDRAAMRGPIPYYGASGVVDYVDSYLFNEDLILLGEDGENILSRVVPLAFKITGKSWVNNHAHVLRPRTEFDIDFLTAYLESLDYSGLNTGTAQPKLNKQSCSTVRVAKPPLPEQRRIATVLSDADALIATLERMIDKKQAIRRGMMQQLLTGKTRLPGFTERWSTATLGTLGTFLKGRGVKRDDVRSTGIRCVRYGEIYTAFHDYTAEASSFVSADVAATALPLRTGDLMFAGSGETREEIGKCVAYVGPTPAVAGGDVIVLRGDQCNSIYLALLANTPDVVSQKARIGQGDAVVHIYSNALAAVEVNLPPRDEQDSIAHVIVDVDREIGVLGQRLRKAEVVKQGMMQELLAGRTRLPVATSP